MLQRFEQSLLRQPLIAPHDTVLCAVSGGADSVALLLLLYRLSGVFPFVLHVAHLNHCLRPESTADAEFVADLCARLQVPLSLEVVDVAALAAERREGVEAAGRFARRRFFAQVAQELGCTSVALAHHADDQAETILFRLLRGTGVGGLAGMLPRQGVYIRPLLPFRGAELRDWLTVQGQGWREDASNADLAYSRNRIRHQILPELQQFNPTISDALRRLGAQVALEEADWQQRVDAFLDAEICDTADGLDVSIPALLKESPALRRRVLRGLLVRVRGDLMRIDAGHLDQLDGLLIAPRPQAQLALPGLWVARRYDRLLVAVSPPELFEYSLLIPEPGVYALPTGIWLRLEIVSHATVSDDATVAFFAAAAIPFPLIVRSPRPGDRFKPAGMDGHKRLKDYFIDARIDHETRRRTPLVLSGERLLWVAGQRRCAGDLPQAGAPVLKMSLESPKDGEERLLDR
jgi:tRNA(Ile)-lysidine synthase